MPGPGPIDPHHAAPRRFFRIAGPILLISGLALLAAGILDFLLKFGSMETPTLFLWCPCAGMPLLAAGGVMTKLGYMGRIARYVSQETTPVATDTFNYAAHQVKGGVRDLAQAIGEGLRGASPPSSQADGAPATPAELACPRCLHKNDLDARFCSQCGSALAGHRECPNCRHENDFNANFCDNCGRALGT